MPGLNTDFCVISNNCWGGQLYKDLNVPFNTPFIGLLVYPACFVKLCNNLDYYLKQELTFISESKYGEPRNYPIGLLDDIEIHFMHYHSEKEASEKWNRRVARMPKNPDSYVVKACDSEDTDWNEFALLWNTIPYRKIFFSAKQRPDIQDTLWIFESSRNAKVTDGFRLYKQSKTHIHIKRLLAGLPYKRGALSRWIQMTIYKYTPRRIKYRQL